MNPLLQEIKNLILHNGPIGLDQYMNLCLTHPVHGYYITRDPLGAQGDFITAPEISQMFGEMIGLWVIDTWHKMGAPSPFHLVELGPGRGTLMSDLLRVARKIPAFWQAVQIHLIEVSSRLRACQKTMLEPSGSALHWHEDMGDVPHGPFIVVANEFFDALPVRHLIRGEKGWHERQVGLDENGNLRFGLSPDPDPAIQKEAPLNTIWEFSPARSQMMQIITARLVVEKAAALIIDYGYDHSKGGETFQAVRAHQFTNPLDDPGLTDLTAHVDFAALSHAAAGCGAKIHGPVAQGDFLRALGIETRAKQLKVRADREQTQQIEQALLRLTSAHSAHMGALFKTLCITHPNLPMPSGF
jgi:NADH dehydrogenase [ubiquinone] 1 alpha subcomplex assembly factor 7